MDCKKCGEPLSVLQEAPVKLIGDHMCLMCCDCQNLWHEHIFSNNEYVRLCEIEIQLNVLIAKTQTDPNAAVLLQPLYEEKHVVKERLYRAAKEWTNDFIGIDPKELMEPQ